MIDFLPSLLAGEFLPQGAFYRWNPTVLWLNVVSDALIAVAYYTISILLFVFVRKSRDRALYRVPMAFSVSLFASGTTHLLGVWMVWHPVYRLDGLAKAVTAVAALAAACLVLPLLATPVKLPASAEVARVNRVLSAEIEERNDAARILLQQAGLLDLSHDAIMVRRPDGTILFWNAGAEVMYGWPKSEALGCQAHNLLKTRYPLPIEHILSQLAEVGRWEGELVHTTRSGETVVVASRWARRKAEDGGMEILEINTDITRQKAAEDHLRELNQELEQRVVARTAELRNSNEQLRDEISRRRALEEQLLQSQKMEAVGQLAGGVAHDFNNLLTIIIGHGRLLAEELAPDSPFQDRLLQLLNAADRAAGLVDQLLAFSRRQIVQPRPLNLNSVVENAGKMLRRVIGEDIHLATSLSPVLGNAKVDPGQIEQALLNLIINAKDAMPRGGSITIETANIELTDAGATQLGLVPGQYVALSVTDTGIGMSASLQARIFEPFFTTKGPGKGTGLGLSTVYGIVKQNQGAVSVHSEPGRGSTFQIYLPRCAETTESFEPASPGAGMPRGTETILLVEDEADVRKLARDVLRRLGYTVLECASGEEALDCCALYRGRIHLALTDVVMPGLSGGQLGEKLRETYPAIRVLYMTGYAEDEVVHHGRVDPKVKLLQKPFTPQALALKVRQVLDAQSATVLVVDDEPEVRRLVREILERAGYLVSEAGSAADAIIQLECAPVEVILTDVVMSQNAASATAGSFLQRQSNVKVVLMSGAPVPQIREVATRIRAHAMLSKPIQAAQLLETVQRLLGRPRF